MKSGGGQLKCSNSFIDIRKQVIWGNKFITSKNRYLLFKNWINSNLIFVNDILDDNGKLSEKHILSKLENKTNWISEFSILKKAIPKEWVLCLSCENSIKTKVNIKKNKWVWNNQFIDINIITNKCFYMSLLKKKNTKPIGIEFWVKYLKLEENPRSDTYLHIYFFFLRKIN